MGHAHMDLAGAAAAMNRLAADGQELASGWAGAQSAIAAGEAGIGGDVLGQAFRGVYAEQGAALREAAGAMPGLLGEDAAVGSRAVADYREADVSSSEGF